MSSYVPVLSDKFLIVIFRLLTESVNLSKLLDKLKEEEIYAPLFSFSIFSIDN